MNTTQAKKIAVQVMKKQAQKLAFNANLYDKLGIDVPTTRNSSEMRKLLLEAISLLKQNPELL